MGFPFGAQCTEAKLAEIKKAYPFADEFDFVVNRQAFKNRDYGFVLKELKTLALAKRGKIMKVIIESPELTDKEIYKASRLVLASGADFVKTAVGLKAGAKISDVKIMKKLLTIKSESRPRVESKTLKPRWLFSLPALHALALRTAWISSKVE